jgi:DNA polymerase-4
MEKQENNFNCRKIIHIDMDAFFAAVEVRDHPEYKGKPVVVGGSPQSRGVVSTCSYEARKFGIHSAMASSIAYKLCPHAIFVHGRFEEYKKASQQIQTIFFEVCDQVEMVSIDEGYLDVTENKWNEKSATNIAKWIKNKIFQTTKLTASAGVSYNKFLAKIASDLNKPDGLVVIPPQKAMEVLDTLPIRKFHGIGKVSEKKMLDLGIKNGLELRKWSLLDLNKHFGKVGTFYYNVVRGIDEREVKTYHVRKSIGKERTFAEDIAEPEKLLIFLQNCAHDISQKLQEKGAKAKTVTLKIKFANFDIITKSKTAPQAVQEDFIIFQIVRDMFLLNLQDKRKIRLLGISVSNLQWAKHNSEEQLLLPFFDTDIILEDENYFC